MDDALDGMLDIICGDAAVPQAVEPPDNIQQDEEKAAINELLGIEPPEVNIEIRHPMIEVYPFDPDSNMTVSGIREDFKCERVFRETDIFTEPTITTITMEGFLSNVQCHEREFIEDMEADEEFVRIKNNFGERVYRGYQPPPKVKKSNRGRKKKLPPPRKRKRQGTGECFNSQTTFVMPSPDTIITDGVVPSDAVIYKFKVFRTGKIQLPGLRNTAVIDNIMLLISRLLVLLNFHLHTCEKDPVKLTKLVNLNPVMKNYKFRIKLPEKWIVDLSNLRGLLQKIRTTEYEGPKIFDIKYTRQETKLSVRFKTPIRGNLKKCVRVNIFQSGKINILGGHSKETTDAICEFLHNIFKKDSSLFAKLGSADDQLDNNIPFDLHSVKDCINSYWRIPCTIGEKDAAAIINYLEDCYTEYMRAASREYQLLFGSLLL